MPAMIGETGIARGNGMVFVHGELWQAQTHDGAPLEPGQRVAVDDVQGLRLVVHRV
jgi:membrane-bound ClpP family serine protease